MGARSYRRTGQGHARKRSPRHVPRPRHWHCESCHLTDDVSPRPYLLHGLVQGTQQRPGHVVIASILCSSREFLSIHSDREGAVEQYYVLSFFPCVQLSIHTVRIFVL